MPIEQKSSKKNQKRNKRSDHQQLDEGATGFWKTNESKLKEKNENSKFASACQKIQEGVTKYLETHQIEDLSDEDAEEEIPEEILARVVSSAGDAESVKDALSTGNLTCLICIHAIKRPQKIWNCSQCFVVLHLSCIQKWGDDSIYQASERLTRDQFNLRVDVSTLQWSCPKCRHEYPQRSIPRQYLCYCGKKQDPVDDPWVLPHSCGSPCSRKLKGECTHTCLMLCHPGACAPCPQMVSTRCHCGQGGPTPRRCSRKSWSCNKTCSRLLSCGQHRCEETCHPGECSPCPRTSVQRCSCGAEKQTRPCSDPSWKCLKVCGKKFPKCSHNCTEVCHAGPCEPLCPLSSSVRRCPCGKTLQKDGIGCDEVVPPCGDTCGKILSCGSHQCQDRCHTGSCSSCIEYTNKECLCGAKRKNIQCSKELTCDVKCKRTKDCGKHPCNKKCCIGDCPPCKLPCNKTLQCGNHKCSSRCHAGQCFPCNLTSQISCRCGASVSTVACGRAKKAKPPKCREDCKLKSKCHHSVQPTHKCHPGDCPRCQQVCNHRHHDCQHSCPKLCHDVVAVTVRDDRKRAGPWEPVMSPRVEIRKLPCPPCAESVYSLCRGRHCVEEFKCSEAKQFSCGRTCARTLNCGLHFCQRGCHKESGDSDCGDRLTKVEKKIPLQELEARVITEDAKQSPNCSPCLLGCEKERVCPHPCPLSCHASPCPPCLEKVKVKCFCRLTTKTKLCHEHYPKRESFVCGNPCIKKLVCGHTCTHSCHAGECSDSAQCTEKVPVRCKCTRRRREVECRVREEQLPCDQTCEAKVSAKKKAEEEEKRRKEEEKEAERRREVEEFERKRAGRKRKKKEECYGNEQEGSQKFYERKEFLFALVILLLSLFMYWVLSK